MPELTPPEGSNEFAPTGEIKPGTLGRYRLLGELGRGGCGVVYRALDPSIGRMVAIKTILAKDEAASGRESRERFRREARSAGNLSHPNIVTIHDFSDSGDPMYIAMEFIDGRTLAEEMLSGPLSLEFILGVMRAAADALDYAHGHNIVHRDIKPANFLLDKSGRLKITDFGIAKILDSDEGLTSTGMLVGTAQYMSPEQVSEGKVTGRSDQFSLAVIAYEMLTGVKPFQGNSWATVIHAIIMAEPPPIGQYREKLGDTVDGVLRKALSKDPQSRYASCTEFYTNLERAISGVFTERTAILPRLLSAIPPAGQQNEQTLKEPIPANPDPTREAGPPAVRRPALKPVLIGALGGVAIVAGLWLGLRPKSARPVVPAVVPPLTQATETREPASAQPAADTAEIKPAPRVAAPSVKQPPKQTETTAAVPVTIPQQTHPQTETPKPVETAPAKPPEPVVTAQQVQQPPLPAPPPVKAQEDAAKRLGEEQQKRAADEQTKRLADEQAKRAADDQARRLADEQAKNARTADAAAISRALRDYQAAYERKDAGALQAIWPSIPKQVLEGIRGSFRQASEVSMELRPVGEPKISGGAATVICDRNLHQVILKRALQASNRVRIALVRAGAGWTIQSIDQVSQ